MINQYPPSFSLLYQTLSYSTKNYCIKQLHKADFILSILFHAKGTNKLATQVPIVAACNVQFDQSDSVIFI
jgi:hypothetical protein